MKDGIFIVMLLAMAAVLVALTIGIFIMARGDAQKSQKMMRLRVVLQGAALLLFALAMILKN